jgi:hypothetical protein
LDFWQVFEENLMEAQFSNEEARRGVRHLLASTVDLEMDNQNRVTLTPELLERARIKNGAVLNGVVTHLELWSPEIWDDYIAAQGAPTLSRRSSPRRRISQTTRQVREIRSGSNGGPSGLAGGVPEATTDDARREVVSPVRLPGARRS